MPNDFWDERYKGNGYFYGTSPNTFLVSQAWRLAGRLRVLAVADGEGRNGVWLAQQGHEVLSVDSSAVALNKAAALARSRDVCLTTLNADLLEWGWRPGWFDAVVAVFIHFPPAERRQVHAAMVQSLKPGGVLILEGFHKRQLGKPSGGPQMEEMLYDCPMLADDFAALEIEELTEGVVRLDEGRHSGPAEVVRLVARKPDGA